MQRNTLRFGIDSGMIVTFLLVFITGMLKMPEFLALSGFSGMVVPMSRITLIHDRSGVVFGVFVILHFALNAKQLVAMGKKLLR
ncbi:MAG: DUF4405 domain-containing protein [Methanomicrobiales archaeon]|nr:DUF4405 domain-containing protein [Methanomicrobiales archaeon]